MNPRELLVETLVYMPPTRALEGLTDDDARRQVPGANHSIAQILGHLVFWQDWFCARCDGTAVPMIATAADGWPEIAPGAWFELQHQFLDGLERLASLGDRRGGLDAPVTPPIEFPPLANYTIGDALVHCASHNAHHLGQVVLLRQMLGLWPPPSGSWTW
jgi:uncharacterized damage-inducible protein DinB